MEYKNPIEKPLEVENLEDKKKLDFMEILEIVEKNGINTQDVKELITKKVVQLLESEELEKRKDGEKIAITIGFGKWHDLLDNLPKENGSIATKSKKTI